MKKTRRCTTGAANKSKSNGFVERQNHRKGETLRGIYPRQTSRGGGEESLKSPPLDSTLRNDIGRELDRVIEELFEVESKQGRRGRAALLSLWQEDQRMVSSSDDELEDIDALLGNDGEDEDEDDNAPFYGFPTPDDSTQTGLIALIKTFECEESFEALKDDKKQDADELGCKEEEWKPELFSTACRKTQKA